MGQYYNIINLDKKEAMDPFDFDNGMKLMEWSYTENRMCIAMMNLMAGPWKGDRVYVIGDYADDTESEVWLKAFKAIGDPDIYHTSDAYLHRIPKDHSMCFDRKDFKKTKDVSTEYYGYRYIYNHRQECYIDLEHCPIEWVWYDKKEHEAGATRIFPLSLLLAMGNGRGGGDYRGDNDYLCGSWCEDVRSVEITKDKLDVDYEEVIMDFTEHALIPWTELESYVADQMLKDNPGEEYTIARLEAVDGDYEEEDHNDELKEKVTEAAEGAGWDATFSTDGGDASVNFTATSPGGDELEISGYYGDLDDIIRAVRDRYDGFDTEEYVYDWLCAKHNGCSGVPGVSELLEDAEEIEQMYRDLLYALEDIE